jgi:hypothetical protein
MIEPNLDLQTLEERLKKIEKQNRYLKLSGILIVLLGLISGLVGGAIYSKLFPGVIPDHIFAKNIQAETIYASQNVSVKELRLLDKGVRARLGVWDNAPSLRFYDKKDNDTLTLGVDEDEVAYFNLNGKNGGSSIGIGFNEYNLPVINFIDDKQKNRLSIYLGGNNIPAIILNDEKEKGRIGLYLDEVGEPRIALYDAKENTRAVLGSVKLMKKEAEEHIKFPPSSLVLFNDKGVVIWKAPPLH